MTTLDEASSPVLPGSSDSQPGEIRSATLPESADLPQSRPTSVNESEGRPLLTPEADETQRDSEAKEVDRRARARFWHALPLAILAVLYIFSELSSFAAWSRKYDVHQLPAWADWGDWDKWYPHSPRCETDWVDEHDLPIAPRCSWCGAEMPPWDSYQAATSKTSFSLPLSSPDLFIDSRGYARGKIHVELADDIQDVVVIVEAIYSSRTRWVRDAVKVCPVKRGNGGEGVVIYTPGPRILCNGRYSQELGIDYAVTVRFPSARAMQSSRSIYIPSFEIATPRFQQTIASLEDDLLFGKLRFITWGINELGINITGLSVVSGSLHIVGGLGVYGKLYTNDSFNVTASVLKVDLGMFISNKALSDKPSSLSIVNSGHIAGSISLLNSSDSLASGLAVRNGSYNLTFQTRWSYIDVTIPTMPASSTLFRSATTTNAPINVTLPPAYEGTFHALTNGPFNVDIIEKESADPEGKGRSREAYWNVSRWGSEVEGDVKWVEHLEPARDMSLAHRNGWGGVDLLTSNAPIGLTL
ncbi:hypothetical protein SISNIDRAFT_460573 [Sistotremastrum niveocremeum HHB9708]|uniref:Uncharacterized protein n=1 Tax=Sistotremastrum niveocremeum HHB9708 TaxID=1314777 RepID=A0A164NKT6_9AGAM|nr:hypothetical protein SISNIDRAFT_460573 [Sistotremastrum niveocremeum HHB9708]